MVSNFQQYVRVCQVGNCQLGDHRFTKLLRDCRSINSLSGVAHRLKFPYSEFHPEGPQANETLGPS
jgi:hypothetical protein